MRSALVPTAIRTANPAEEVFCVNITNSPYSAQGATISRLLSVGYLSGKSKTNPEMLIAERSLPDLSGTKLNTDGAVFFW